MAKRKDKTAERVNQVYQYSRTDHRVQWEYINQKGYDFANDNQLSHQEKVALEEQGMPTFTINRIIPVVEMLNYYATASNPRWQAIGTEGSDSDVAAVFSDIADYIWNGSNGDTLLSNAVNDSVTKSLGYLLVTVDPDADRGMGEVVIQQPDPFDVYVDNKSRDILFRDAAYILIRKILPKGHLINQFPDSKRKIMAASSNQDSYDDMSEKARDGEQHDFHYKEMNSNNSVYSEKENELLEFFEYYVKEKMPLVNVFYKVLPSKEVIDGIKQSAEIQVQRVRQEMEVTFKEKEAQMKAAVQEGKMLPERMELELRKEQEMMANQLKSLAIEIENRLQEEASKVENTVVSKKEFEIMMKDRAFPSKLVEAIHFHENRIKLCCVVGDKTLYEKYLPIQEYPIIPFHYKWTGTPFPMSAVSPLIGKQREMNKAHQLMIHNASLGSSLRWMYDEGSIDTDYWERYSSAPGALLPKRQGYDPPVPVQPFQLNNAFFGLVNQGKSDMEYLAGIYSSMQGDVGATGDMPYRGMLAMDEYGTRRIKYWLKHCIEPALKQVGEVVKQYSQMVYTAHKVFRIVQPNAITEERTVEINVPMYNDFGEAVGKWRDYSAAKFDVRIVSGSTLPVNRWAYLEELKQLMNLGVVDDVAVLAETDIRNKEQIVKRKSLYSQLQSQIASLEEQLKKEKGANETLERQVIQSGIKNKILQSDVEISKQTHDTKSNILKEELETKSVQKHLRKTLQNDMKTAKEKAENKIKNKPLENTGF
tara:strand:+ start:450 stop:2732 length:2283 start_codon:yes stop_codon:yes gene_type:complete